MALSAEDMALLGEYETSLALVRDRVSGICKGYLTGLYLWGRGGVSKSYTVLETLRKAHHHFRHFNSRMTARGLVDSLASDPDAVHVLEDMEKITHDRDAQGVLRSALHGQRDPRHGNRQRRVVTWTAFKTRIEFEFRGAIIMSSNCAMANLPELEALQTRIAVLHLDPTEEQIRAMMRYIALRGFVLDGEEMTPNECQEVCEHIIALSAERELPLNLRVQDGASCDYLQWRHGHSTRHWKDLVETRLRQQPLAPTQPTRAETLDAERDLVRQIAELPPQERLEAWKTATGTSDQPGGKSQAAMYRRLKEIGV